MTSKKQNPYEKEHTKPIFSGTKLNVTPIDVKLFGLKTKGGEVVIPLSEDILEVKSDVIRLQELTSPKRNSKETSRKKTTDSNDRECTFRPQRSVKADKAMANPRCGYDFVRKLGDRGDFLERAFKKSEKSKGDKAKLDQEKEDYEARQDKLQCPQCKKYQSFDEHCKRSRVCGQCKERFVQLHVSNRAQFEKIQKDHLDKKRSDEESLRNELYAFTFTPTLENNFRIKKKELAANILEKTRQAFQKTSDSAYIERKSREEEEKRKKEQMLARTQARMEAATKRIYESKRLPSDTLEGLLQVPLQPPPPPSAPAVTKPAKPAHRPHSAGSAAQTKRQLPPSSTQVREEDIAEQFKKLIVF